MQKFRETRKFFSCFSKTPQTSHKQRGVGGKYGKFFIAIDHPHAFVSEEKKPKFSAFFQNFFLYFKIRKIWTFVLSTKKVPELTFNEIQYAYSSISNGHSLAKFGPIFKPTFFLHDYSQISTFFEKYSIFAGDFFVFVRYVPNLCTW